MILDPIGCRLLQITVLKFLFLPIISVHKLAQSILILCTTAFAYYQITLCLGMLRNDHIML